MDSGREMSVPELDWALVEPGHKGAYGLSFETRQGEVCLPLLVAKGVRPGKTLVVSAGVHGDEYEGVQTLFDVFAGLDTKAMSGAVVMVTVANPPAFWAGTRTSPLDGGNLARVFPGDRDGSATEAIAWHFDQRLLSIADFYLDLHSAGVKWLMPTMIGYHEGDEAARLGAEAFGAPVVWCHPKIAAGRTVSAAMDRGVPCLYAEARGAGRIDAGDLRVYVGGVWRLMRHLGIAQTEVDHGVREPVRLYGDGNIDKGIEATERGFLVPAVGLLEAVEPGQALGRLVDLWGRTITEFVAPCAGVVALIHACPLVMPGEPLFLITERVQ
jgi:predicted deacylase